MRPQKRHIQLIAAILEEEAESQVAAALEQLAAKLADAEAAVTALLAEALSKITEA